MIKHHALLLAVFLSGSGLFAGITVTKPHPNRLVMDETRLAAVQTKMGSQEWADFKAYIDANKSNVGSTWTDFLTATAMGSALICRATGDTSYCTSALAQMEAARVQGARTAWYTVTFDGANDWLIDPIGEYPTSTPALAGFDFPVRFWSFYNTGVLPTPLAFNTTYWIRWHHVDNSAGGHSYWTIAATKGGAALDITGTYSGQILMDIPWRLAGGHTGSNAPRTFLAQWAVLYDWLYSYMTADQKSEWYSLLRSSMQFVSSLDYTTGGKILNNVWVGDHRGGILYGIAIIGDNPSDTAAVQAIMDKLEGDFSAELAANGALLTGGFIEGTEYTPEQQLCLWELWDAIWTASGRTHNRFTALQRYYTEMLDYYTHAFHTGSYVSSGRTYKDLIAHGEILQDGQWNIRVGGAKRLAPASTHRKMLLYLQETMKMFGDTARASYAKKLIDEYAPITALKDAGNGWRNINNPYDPLFESPGTTAAMWSSSALVRWFAGTNEVFMKSGWASTATDVNVFGSLTNSGTSAIDHVKSEAGGFSFYRKGTTLTGNWSAYPSDVTNVMPYELRSYPGSGVWASSHSVMVPAGINSWNTLISGHSEGQASLDRFETAGGVTYGDMNLTGVYRHHSGVAPPQAWDNTNYLVTDAHREWMYVEPDTLVIHDKIIKSQATPASQWNLQAQAHSVSLGSGAATISADGQFLKATVVLPANSKMVVKRSDRVYVQWVSREAAPVLVFEANLSLNNETTTMTLSGATGEWAVLNGTWNVTAIDGRNIRINAGQVSTAGIASGFGGQALVLEGHGAAAPLNNISGAYDAAVALTGGRYLEVGGTEATNEHFLVVMEGVDVKGTALAVTALAASNLHAVQIGDSRVVGFVPGSNPILPISYTHTATGEHRIAGLIPRTKYSVDVSVAGMVVIRDSGQGADITSSAAGVLAFYPGGPALILPRLNLSPAVVTFQCTAGGANPASERVSLEVVAGGLSAWTAAAAQRWLVVTPASGTATGSMTLSANCAGLTQGEYQDTVTLQTTPPPATGSTSSVSVRLRVEGAPEAPGGKALQGIVRIK